MNNIDVIVVGAGLAGLCAAITTAEAGLHTLVLEKTATSGGSSAMSGGCLAFAGTDLQQARGIEDSAELLFQDLVCVGKGDCDNDLVSAYTDHQLETYEWLRARGVEFAPLVEAASGQSVPRVHNVDPADMVRALERCLKTFPNATIRFDAPVERLLRDDCQVTGVSAMVEGKHTDLHAGHGVILTSGGFVQSRELVHAFAPQYDDAVFIGGEGNTGDGLRMAWALGADLRDMAHIKGTFGKHPIDDTNHHACLAVYKGAIAVNQDGHRYVDESLSYKLLGDACMKQPYGVTYQILDAKIMRSGENRVRILDFERRLEEGLFLEAPSFQQLARIIEVPEDVLIAEIDAYNRAVESNEPPEFGRRHLVHQYGELCTISEPPFYAYPSTAAVFGTYCGLRVDSSMRVVDVFGETIRGLRAAGEVVGGFHGAAYMTGSALGKAAIFGRIAGATVNQVEK